MAPKSRPYDFRPSEVAAVVRGIKTQIRVPLEEPDHPWQYVAGYQIDFHPTATDGGFGVRPVHSIPTSSNSRHYDLDKWCMCPLGGPGDEIWGRESWSIKAYGRSRVVVYNSDEEEYYPTKMPNGFRRVGRRSSISMPNWASRIFLRISSVRIERLRSISANDAQGSGLTAITKDGRTVKYGIPDLDGFPGTDNLGWEWSEWEVDPRNAYFKTDECRKVMERSGLADPLVWVVDFKKY